jgi:hypothetical protein
MDNRTDEVLSRVMHALRLRRWTQLADAMNTNIKTLSSWRYRDSVPYEAIHDLCRRRSISLEFVFNGREPASAVDVDRGTNMGDIELSQQDRAILSAMRSLKSGQREIIILSVSEALRLNQLEIDVRQLRRAEIDKQSGNVA